MDRIESAEMKIGMRAYAGDEDKERITALVCASARDNLHVMDLPYRLSSWAFDFPDNVGLWVDEAGQLIAWAVMQTPMWVLDYAHLPTADVVIIHDHILTWAEQRARQIIGTVSGHPMWFVNLREDQPSRIRALEAAGFTCQADTAESPWRKAFLRHAPQDVTFHFPVPAGFTIRPLCGQSEVEAYVDLHRAAFGSHSMTCEWRSRVIKRPERIADLDLVAVSSEGRLAAFCIGWFINLGLSERPAGQIEPIGVHPDFRRQGLGQAILSETLRRLRAYGAEDVYVETDENGEGAFDFYQSMGFRVAHRVLVYRKDYCSDLKYQSTGTYDGP